MKLNLVWCRRTMEMHRFVNVLGAGPRGGAVPYWQFPILLPTCVSDMVMFFPPMFILMLPR